MAHFVAKVNLLGVYDCITLCSVLFSKHHLWFLPYFVTPCNFCALELCYGNQVGTEQYFYYYTSSFMAKTYQRYLLPKLRNQCKSEETPSSDKINSVTAEKAFGLHLNIVGVYKSLLS